MADTETKPVAAGKLAKHAGADAQRKAGANYLRADYARGRGHRTYIAQARRNERFYLGAGEQWERDDKATLAESGRKPVEDNQIMPMVNTAIGYQIANRMDIAVRPRGHGADDVLATAVGRLLKYMADSTQLHWRETEVFADGMIKQRGYFDVRMSFEDNILGKAVAGSLDPEDVIPDPDARSYDPADWGDVTIDRWYTLIHIEQLFGKAAMNAVKTFCEPDATAVLSNADGHDRNRFGPEGAGDLAYYSELGDSSTQLYHVVERQYRTYELTQCAVWPTGDIEVADGLTKEQLDGLAKQGAMLVKRMHKRVKWIVSTRNVLLFDDYSPYPWFTIVPFFPYFRRGKTRGMVDNAIGPQECLNKALSQMSHILNTAANSGWKIEQNSVTNMTVREFEQKAAQNGLIIEYKQNATKPEKIEPSQVPTGIVEYIAQMKASLVSSTGMDEALTSSGPMNEMSGVAYQARQYAAQQKLAVPLDNLARTRYMLGQRLLDLGQMFYDTPRLLRITEMDAFGKEKTTELAINQPVIGDDGEIEYLNDMTVGEYDLVISEQPMQITFDNSQFEQVKSLAVDFGYKLPPRVAIRYSSIAEKEEVASAIEAENAAQPNPIDEAKAELAKAQAAKTVAETVNKRIEAVYSATQAGAQIAAMPQIASLADEILQSGGFEDQNAAPIIPQVAAGAGLTQAAPAQPLVDPNDPNGPAPTNTNPLTPSNPGVGLNAGIEAPGVQ